MGDPIDVLIMGIWTIVFNLVAGNIVSPLVYGRTVHIHPAIVLVAIPAGSAIAGPIGMFVVVPAIGIVAATWRTVVSLMSDSRARGLPAQAPPDTVDLGRYGALPDRESPQPRHQVLLERARTVRQVWSRLTAPPERLTRSGGDPA